MQRASDLGSLGRGDHASECCLGVCRLLRVFRSDLVLGMSRDLDVILVPEADAAIALLIFQVLVTLQVSK